MLVMTATDVSVLQFTTYSNATVAIFISVFVVVIFIILVIASRMIAKQKQLEEHAIQHNFKDNCRRFGFDSFEVEAIESAVRKILGDINDIFELQNVYERVIHDDIEAMIDSGKDLTMIENLYGSIRKKLHYILLPEGIPLTSTRSISSGHIVSMIDLKCEALLVENRETCFILKYPPEHSIVVNQDSILRVAFSRSGDGLYSVDTKVMEHSGGRIKCRHSINLKRHQLRRDVRMKLNGRIRLFMRDPENNRIVLEGRLIDISAGGVCFESPGSVPVKSILTIESCSLPLQLAGIRTQILSSSQREKDNEIMFKYHTSYVQIPFDKKEKIVSYLFVRMRELQKK
ncbi:MAG: PilZ domain-containing protein [Fibrobacter sp.]|nr:PilZ domain-containing protein [Fibrobacter sp.]